MKTDVLQIRIEPKKKAAFAKHTKKVKRTATEILTAHIDKLISEK